MAEESYIVSARKYRPATFDTVVGQKALTTTLKNAIQTGRMAQAYLFCGPRGVGKTSCARIFARTINCMHPTPDGEACGECESCRSIDNGNSFNIIELDAASNNSVDDIRMLTEQVNVPPQMGTHRVFIIDEVHMLSSQAFNAFLKTLEEPPAYVVFILATTEKHKVIPTILSRCQIYDFKRITIADMVEHLQFVAGKEGIKADPAALNVIAQKADGAMRDALSIFDQITASSRGHITYQSAIENLNILDYDYYFRLVDAFMAGDVQQSLMIYKEVRDKGFDSLFFVNGLASHIRDLIVASDSRTLELLEVGSEIGEKYVEQSRRIPVKWTFQALKLLSDCDLNYRVASNKQLFVELVLIRLCSANESAAVPAPELVPLKPSQNPPEQAPGIPSLSAEQKAATMQTIRQPQQAQQSPQPVASQPTAPQQVRQTVSRQPQPVQQPQPQPTVRPQASARSSRPGSFRIKGHGTSAEPDDIPDPAAQPDGQILRRDFTVEDVAEAWNSFIAENGDKQILTAAMRASMPVVCSGTQYTVRVTTPTQVEQFENSMHSILEHLRSHLNNDQFSLRVELSDDDAPSSVRIMTPQEFVSSAMDKNAVLSHLLEEIEAEICE